MITEDYVSFKIAKLLKEKGFDENCTVLYHLRTGEISQQGVGYVFNNSQWENFITAPTLQMAMKWLRDVHNMYVFPFPQMNTNKFWVEIYQLSNNQKWENLYCETIDLQDYSFYEEACEAGIRYCLENLI